MKKFKTLGFYLLISFSLSLAWMFAGGKMYKYNYDFPIIAGINIFPLTAWAIGLSVVFILYLFMEKLLNIKSFSRQLCAFLILYWPLLIVGETAGYYIFNVHNLPTASYEGLPLFKCMHAPMWMQAVYFGMGPLYFLVIKIFHPKNRRMLACQNGRAPKD